MTTKKDGTILDAVKRRGVTSLEPSSEMKAITDRFAIAHGLSRASDSYFGRTQTIIVRREKLVEMVFPIDDRLVIVSATPKFPLGKVSDLEKLLRALGAG